MSIPFSSQIYQQFSAKQSICVFGPRSDPGATTFILLAYILQLLLKRQLQTPLESKETPNNPNPIQISNQIQTNLPQNQLDMNIHHHKSTFKNGGKNILFIYPSIIDEQEHILRNKKNLHPYLIDLISLFPQHSLQDNRTWSNLLLSNCLFQPVPDRHLLSKLMIDIYSHPQKYKQFSTIIIDKFSDFFINRVVWTHAHSPSQKTKISNLNSLDLELTPIEETINNSIDGMNTLDDDCEAETSFSLASNSSHSVALKNIPITTSSPLSKDSFNSQDSQDSFKSPFFGLYPEISIALASFSFYLGLSSSVHPPSQDDSTSMKDSSSCFNPFPNNSPKQFIIGDRDHLDLIGSSHIDKIQLLSLYKHFFEYNIQIEPVLPGRNTWAISQFPKFTFSLIPLIQLNRHLIEDNLRQWLSFHKRKTNWRKRFSRATVSHIDDNSLLLQVDSVLS